MEKEPLSLEGVTLIVGSPEGGSTIEGVPGASIETAHEVARLVERAAARATKLLPPNIKDVLAEMDKNERR